MQYHLEHFFFCSATVLSSVELHYRYKWYGQYYIQGDNNNNNERDNHSPEILLKKKLLATIIFNDRLQ